ncbi:class I SAM-dependent methyltransferase [candidate division KSB1 bacterium]
MKRFEEKDLEFTNCPLCNSGNNSTIYGFSPFNVVKCTECSFFFLNPRLTEDRVREIYREEDYFSGSECGYSDYSSQELALRRTFRKLLSNLEKCGLTGGSLLEIGCGYGYLLDEAKGLFEYRAGTEFSKKALDKAEEITDIVIHGGVDDIGKEREFDCIIAVQVIEHVYDPKKFVSDLAGHLKPGGVLVLAAPNIGGFWHYVMRKKWASFILPEHVQYFDKISIQRLLIESGMKNVQVIPYPHAFPASLVFQKLKIPFPGFLKDFNIWIPGTTVAAVGIANPES